MKKYNKTLKSKGEIESIKLAISWLQCDFNFGKAEYSKEEDFKAGDFKIKTCFGNELNVEVKRLYTKPIDGCTMINYANKYGKIEKEKWNQFNKGDVDLLIYICKWGDIYLFERENILGDAHVCNKKINLKLNQDEKDNSFGYEEKWILDLGKANEYSYVKPENIKDMFPPKKY